MRTPGPHTHNLLRPFSQIVLLEADRQRNSISTMATAQIVLRLVDTSVKQMENKLAGEQNKSAEVYKEGQKEREVSLNLPSQVSASRPILMTIYIPTSSSSHVNNINMQISRTRIILCIKYRHVPR